MVILSKLNKNKTISELFWKEFNNIKSKLPQSIHFFTDGSKTLQNSWSCNSNWEFPITVFPLNLKSNWKLNSYLNRFLVQPFIIKRFVLDKPLHSKCTYFIKISHKKKENQERVIICLDTRSCGDQRKWIERQFG